MDKETPEKVISLRTMEEWDNYYKPKRIEIADRVGGIRMLEVQMKDDRTEISDSFAAVASWEHYALIQVGDLLDIINALVRKNIENQDLLDFVKLLKVAHEGEEAEKAKWK
jgi:hypothetical protein